MRLERVSDAWGGLNEILCGGGGRVVTARWEGDTAFARISEFVTMPQVHDNHRPRQTNHVDDSGVDRQRTSRVICTGLIVCTV